MSPQVPWDGPSHYGRPGLAARRALRRVLRPLTVRIDAELDELRASLVHVRDRQDEDAARRGVQRTMAVEPEQVAQRLSDLEHRVQQAASYASAVDGVLDAELMRRLPPDARTRWRTAGSSRAICSLALGDTHRALLARTALSYERYADRWNWDLVLSTEDLADGRPAPWAKIRLLRELLDEYEWVLWLDTDVVVVDLAADISTEIRDGSDLYLVEHRWGDGQYTANSGVMLIRSGDWARAFLDEVWAQSHYAEHPWWENAAVLDLLGYALEPARLVRPTRWLERTRFIHRRWNSIAQDRADPPVFVHRGFFDTATRSRQVTADLACALREAHPLTAGWDRPARRITGTGDVHRREELPLLLDAMGLTGVGVELGVRKGHFSEHLLAHWSGRQLISVDSWMAAPADEYIDISNVTQAEHDWNHIETQRRLERFGVRSAVWRMDGGEARRRLRDGALDFVYLDARHDRPSVAADLASWWPAVRPGGVMAGHDYLDGDLPAGVFGVRSAVDEFFGALGLHVHSTIDDAPWPSWIVVKPADVQPPGWRTVAAPSSSADVSSIDQALAWLARQEDFVVVQVGAYVGDSYNDPLFEFLSAELPVHPDATALLVEPVTEYFERLRVAYAEVPRVQFENAAIAESAGERDFFRIADDVDPTAYGQADWLTQVGSLRPDRMTKLWEGYEQTVFDREGLQQDFAAFWHAHRIVDRVRCMTVSELLDKHQISRVDLLQIDAEGYDYEILRTLDFTHVRPRFINYERVLLLDDEPACREMLQSAGYLLFDWGQDTLCVAGD